MKLKKWTHSSETPAEGVGERGRRGGRREGATGVDERKILEGRGGGQRGTQLCEVVGMVVLVRFGGGVVVVVAGMGCIRWWDGFWW